MKRTTYLIVALTILLVAGILVALTWSLQADRTRALAATQAIAGAGSRPAGTRGGGRGLFAATRGGTGIGTMATRPRLLTTEPQVHDPVLIKAGDTYYVFYTGGLINVLRSRDLVRWERPVRALGALPEWVRTEVPANRADLWAPDIAFFRGKYLLYYSASTFGSRISAIGLMTTKTLDATSPDFRWEDGGIIVRSRDTDDYNAIDPNFVLDEKGEPWLSFGSFWSGIKLMKLNADGKPDLQNKTLYAIAARKQPETAIEAPFIIREGRYFYLFVSWDRCCQGVSSTYRIMVGRAEKITGPYRDKDGVDMAQGGGTQLLAGDSARLRGPGHQGLFKDAERGWLMVHHYYDGNTANGTPRLQVRPVTFDSQGWPVLGKALNAAE